MIKSPLDRYTNRQEIGEDDVTVDYEKPNGEKIVLDTRKCYTMDYYEDESKSDLITLQFNGYKKDKKVNVVKVFFTDKSGKMDKPEFGLRDTNSQRSSDLFNSLQEVTCPGDAILNQNQHLNPLLITTRPVGGKRKSQNNLSMSLITAHKAGVLNAQWCKKTKKTRKIKKRKTRHSKK